MFIIFSNASATGFIEYFASNPVPFGLPKWEQRTIDLAPCSKQYLIVGIDASIRAVLVIAPLSSYGTL